MNTDNIEVNIQSSIRLDSDKVIYFDPFRINEIKQDADIIFITHNHPDHLDKDSIEKIRNDKTIIVAPKSMEEDISKISAFNHIYLDPFEETNIDSIYIKTIPAYNNNKDFHPRKNNWLGYILTINGITYYIAGDTDATKESNNVKCDIAFIPIGGHFTMDVEEASKLIKNINPKVVIPIHYGALIGDPMYGKELANNLADTNIKIVNKLTF